MLDFLKPCQYIPCVYFTDQNKQTQKFVFEKEKCGNGKN